MSKYGRRIFIDVMEMSESDVVVHSKDQDIDDWSKVAQQIEESYEKYHGFVILHGTDTMAYLTSALSFMFENLGKSVIFTGSQVILIIIIIIIIIIMIMIMIIIIIIGELLYFSHCYPHRLKAYTLFNKWKSCSQKKCRTSFYIYSGLAFVCASKCATVKVYKKKKHILFNEKASKHVKALV